MTTGVPGRACSTAFAAMLACEKAIQGDVLTIDVKRNILVVALRVRAYRTIG